MNTHITTFPPDDYAERDGVDIPRLIHMDYVSGQSPHIYMGESSNPGLVIRALRMKTWAAEDNAKGPSATSNDEMGWRDALVFRSSQDEWEEHRARFLPSRREEFWDIPSVCLMIQASILRLHSLSGNVLLLLFSNRTSGCTNTASQTQTS